MSTIGLAHDYLTTKLLARELQVPVDWVRGNANRLGGWKKGGRWQFQPDAYWRGLKLLDKLGRPKWRATVFFRCGKCDQIAFSHSFWTTRPVPATGTSVIQNQDHLDHRVCPGADDVS